MEHAGSTVDGARASEMLRALAAVGETTCLKEGVAAITDTDATAVVRMLTGSSGSSEGLVRRRRAELEAFVFLLIAVVEVVMASMASVVVRACYPSGGCNTT